MIVIYFGPVAEVDAKRTREGTVVHPHLQVSNPAGASKTVEGVAWLT